MSNSSSSRVNSVSTSTSTDDDRWVTVYQENEGLKKALESVKETYEGRLNWLQRMVQDLNRVAAEEHQKLLCARAEVQALHAQAKAVHTVPLAIDAGSSASTGDHDMVSHSETQELLESLNTCREGLEKANQLIAKKEEQFAKNEAWNGKLLERNNRINRMVQNKFMLAKKRAEDKHAQLEDTGKKLEAARDDVRELKKETKSLSRQLRMKIKDNEEYAQQAAESALEAQRWRDLYENLRTGLRQAGLKAEDFMPHTSNVGDRPAARVMTYRERVPRGGAGV